MRCTESGARLDDRNSLYELKLDGVRMLAERHGEHVQLRYRTQRNATAAFPDLVRALRAIPATRVILDGEIVAFDARGMPSFARLAERIHKTEPRAIAQAARAVPVQYVVFDILALDDLDLRQLPLRARKQILAALLRGKGFVRLLDYADGDGHALFALCQAHALEGVIAKHADSPYVMGPQRSSHWTKLKHVHSDDFVVIGYTRGKGSRAPMGALEVASFAGGKLITRGRVGSGLDDRAIDELQLLLAKDIVKKSPAEGELMAAPAGRTVVAPKVVVSVQHSGFTEEGRLRHPVYRGIRRDVAPQACLAAPGEEREAAWVDSAPVVTVPKPQAHVQVTNPKKIFWPDEGITKGELIGYYDAIADTLLPYLRDRPVLMVRYPDGIEGKHFYQWNVPPGTPSWVRTEIIRDDEDGRDITFFRVEDRDTLL
jgi:bifunctional non-homologous end joining protein LigD